MGQILYLQWFMMFDCDSHLCYSASLGILVQSHYLEMTTGHKVPVKNHTQVFSLLEGMRIPCLFPLSTASKRVCPVTHSKMKFVAMLFTVIKGASAS